MSECQQGQRNSEDVQKLFEMIERRNGEILSMRSDITEIKTLLVVNVDFLKAETKRNKEEIHNHLKDSQPRISDIDKNTGFRKYSIWIMGLFVTGIIYNTISAIKEMITR